MRRRIRLRGWERLLSAALLLTTLPAVECGWAAVGDESAGAAPSTQSSLPQATVRARFTLGGSTLADALDRFGEQSGLQVVYAQGLIDGHAAPSVSGELSVAQALDGLLAGSDLAWQFANALTVLILPADALDVASTGDAAVRAEPRERRLRLVRLGVIQVRDPRRTLPDERSSSAFGFGKLLVDTPRSVSFISKETIDLFGLSSVEDLVRVVPGAFTTTRFGIQGGVDVRSVPADTFFRGMKRINLQGHANSVLSANDSIEVVRGPPSPIFGMGKIGGYTNVVPRGARARDGGYLPETQGFVQILGGDYNHREVNFGANGPLSISGHRGGYSVFGLVSAADSYARGVPNDARLLQSSMSLDRFAGPFRLEAGLTLQESYTAGALIGRFTQSVADTGRYVRGVPLVNLDANGNGRIGFLEMQRGSPVAGSLSVNNQPLAQIFPWQYDSSGRPLALTQFRKVAGIPQTLYDYLNANPDADPTGALRAQGVGGPLPISQSVPIGMALDPRTTGYDVLDIRRFSAYEKKLEANFATAYFDLVWDDDPDFTIKNQLFFDSMNQYKESEQPFGTDQNPRVYEDKLTVTRRVQNLPEWLRINALGSLNYRHTYAPSGQCFGDWSNNRTDAMAPGWDNGNGGMTPNSTFAVCVSNDNINNDGFPYTNLGKTTFSEYGTAALLDIDVFTNTNLLAGARFDLSEARNIDYAGTLDLTKGTAANPGVFASSDASAHGWDNGTSWSLSLSHRLPGQIVPYVTWARSSLTLDNNINRISNAIIANGHIGSSRFTEAGVKASLLNHSLFFSTAWYEQRRTGVNSVGDPSLGNTEVAATLSRGWETEFKWVPVRNFLTSVYALTQNTYYVPNRGGNIQVDARALGFQDVLDPATGKVLYPAEAFLYGGRAFVALPPDVSGYREKQGNPNTQFGFTAQYVLPHGLGFTLSGNYISSVAAGRLQLTELPEARVLNAGVFYDYGPWHLKGDLYNLTDERYFRARSGDTLADLPVSAMPGRRMQLMVRRDFR